jgi:hypothetical protein
MLLADSCVMRATVDDVLTFRFRVVDPAPADRMTYFIDWDASSSEPPLERVGPGANHEIQVMHQFDRPMHFSVRVIVVDDDGSASTGQVFEIQPTLIMVGALLASVEDARRGLVTASGVPVVRETCSSSSESGGNLDSGPLGDMREDVNLDGRVGMDDLLMVVSDLRRHGIAPAADAALDVDQDGMCDMGDMLRIVQYLRSQLRAEGEAPDPAERSALGAADLAYVLVDDEDQREQLLAESDLAVVARDVAYRVHSKPR